MGRKLVFLNILMLAAVLVVALSLVGNWKDFEQRQKPIQAVGSDVQLQETSLPERPASLSLFLDIGAGNLFTEQRGQDPNEGLEDAGEAPPELSPEPTLTSVMTFGEEKTAVLSIAANRRSRKPADVIRVKIGDDVQGYTVAEIEDDHIVLSWREHRREIFLDPEQAQPRKTASRAAGGPRIIVVGAPVAAVGQTTLAAAVEEGRGVQVGTVGQVAQGRQGGADDLEGSVEAREDSQVEEEAVELGVAAEEVWAERETAGAELWEVVGWGAAAAPGASLSSSALPEIDRD